MSEHRLGAFEPGESEVACSLLCSSNVQVRRSARNILRFISKNISMHVFSGKGLQLRSRSFETSKKCELKNDYTELLAQ